MENEKIFELMEKMYADLKGDIGAIKVKLTGVEDRLTGVEDRLTGVEGRLTGVENRLTYIENEHGRKLDALFDGYKQNSEKLTRIEAEVTKHQEVIFRKVY